MNRRHLLKSTFVTGAFLPFANLNAEKKPLELQPTVDPNTGLPLLRLPPGFSYESFSWTGDQMTNKEPIPDRHDGMALVPGASSNEQVLLRNHERFSGSIIGEGNAPVYDDLQIEPGTFASLPEGLKFAGGVTGDLVKDGKYVGTQPLLGGTLINCAGGPTPWGSWLSCEEIVLRGSLISLDQHASGKDHGYVFEVPAPHLGSASADPIKDMGLMKHEAAAVDPQTGIVYLTEDNGPHSGMYRMVPNDKTAKPGALEKGGQLQILRVENQPNANLTKSRRGAVFVVDWVDIEDPDASPQNLVAPFEGLPAFAGSGKSGPFMQGEQEGCAVFGRGEGIWYHDGVMYFVDTAGGPGGHGTVWALALSENRLLSYFVSTSEADADDIDNIAINPASGQAVVCEDGGGVWNPGNSSLRYGSRMLVVGATGTAVAFAENNIDLTDGVADRPWIAPEDYRANEWAGATFTSDGKTLYANVQTPGVTFAIRGPWSELTRS